MTAPELLQNLKANPFVLAPMAGITDRAFRSFMRDMGCGVVTTELVSATGLKYASEKTRKLMEFDENQHPVGVQIFGEELDHLAFAAQAVEQMGADFVDLNFGCPVPKVVKRGAGSAVLKDLNALKDILQTVRRAVKIPVTIKVRTGWDESSRNTNEVLNIAAGEGITWVAIHGRTRAAGYSGAADWSYISSLTPESQIAVIGNGDLVSARLAVSRLQESGCAAVMIGRGCLKNPWIFREAHLLWSGVPDHRVEHDYVLVMRTLTEHLRKNMDDPLLSIQIKKFAAWFSAGLPGASQFRKSVFQPQGQAELIARVEDFFAGMHGSVAEDTSTEPFLMGGHG